MGIKPSRPVVTFAAALDGLKSKLGLEQSVVESYFLQVAKSDGNKSSRLAVETFKIEFVSAREFFEMGDLVSQRFLQVLGFDNDGMNFDHFTCALYLFCCSSEEEKYRFLFTMFDLNGSGFIRKKEFRLMSLAVIKGSNEEIQSSFEDDFKMLEKAMTDSGMILYDTNRDGKLSFEEWCLYAKDDESVQACFLALSSPLGLIDSVRANRPLSAPNLATLLA